MNSNDKITIDIKNIEPFKKINFNENPSSKFLILFAIFITLILTITVCIIIIGYLIKKIRSK